MKAAARKKAIQRATAVLFNGTRILAPRLFLTPEVPAPHVTSYARHKRA